MQTGTTLLLMLAGLLGVPAGIMIFTWYYANDRFAKRLLRGKKLSSIRDFPEGKAARVAGAVRYAGETLEAPLSGRRCAAYVVRVFTKSPSGRNQSGLSQLIEEVHGCPFLVEDETGHALVNPAGAKLALLPNARKRSGHAGDVSIELQALLARHNLSSAITEDLRYDEGTIEEGERVAVFGRGRLEPDPDPDPARIAAGSYRDRPMRLVIEPTRSKNLVISDDPSTLT